MTTIYKIRRKSDGMFSTGGMTPRWSSRGKVWSGVGPLSNHIRITMGNPYKDAEIVTYEVTEQITAVESIDRIKERHVEADRKRAEKLQQTILKMQQAYRI